jgi:hypothetical protein
MGRLTSEQRDRLKEEIEIVLLSGRWSRKVARQLAGRHGLSHRRVQQYRQVVEAAWADESEVADEATERVGWITRCRQAQQRCLQLDKLRELASFLAMEARVLGIEQQKLSVHHSGNLSIQAEVAALAPTLLEMSPEQLAALRGEEPPEYLELEAVEVSRGG